MYSSYEVLPARIIQDATGSIFINHVLRHLPDGTARIAATFWGKRKVKTYLRADRFAADCDDAATQEGF